jgi:hypothetical protein
MAQHRRPPGVVHALLLILALALGAPAAAADLKPDLIIKGGLTGADHQTYRPVYFQVPAGVSRVTLAFDYDRAARTTIDIGLFDPERFRGWSGSNKGIVTVSAEDATASYLPGPIRPGRWTLLLGVPNLRKGVTAAYTARIWFSRSRPRGFVSTFSDRPLKPGLAWYRGDLHMHTAHSDGTCVVLGGSHAPCPLYRTVQTAADRGLDFIAITDHNTISHFEAMRELQPAFPALLLIPGREITTFQGHANVFGTTRFIDFRLGDRALPTVGALIDAVQADGGMLAINHPALPSIEDCMGCGWTAKGTDFSRVTAIEVANGGAERAQGGVEEGPLSGVPYWQARLNEGFRITAIGGSDNHDADIPLDTASAIGRPTTVVEAAGLSETAVLAGIAAGRVFIDLDGPRPRTLDLEAKAGDRSAKMGGVLTVRAGETMSFFVLVHGVAAGALQVIEDGQPVAGPSDATLAGDDVVRPFSLTADGKRHWVRINVRDPKGRLMLIGNPIYLRPPAGRWGP